MVEREAVDLRWLLAVIRRWLWMIVLWTALGMGAAYGANRYTPPVYSASSTLLIQAAVTDFQAIMTSERLARTYSQLLKERTALETVIRQLNLDETPATLAPKISANPVSDTQLIRVSVEHTNPNLAANIANALTNTFIQQVETYQTERYSESMNSIKEQIDEMANQMDATQGKIDRIDSSRFAEDQAEVARLEELQAQYRGTYTGLLQGYEQMRLSAAQSLQTVIIAEQARIPQEPEGHLVLYMSLAGLVGLLVGAGAAFLFEYLDDTIKSAEDIRRALGLQTVGVIGMLARGQRNTLAATEISSPHSEAYRVLGANICFSDADVPLRSLLVTSATEEEGKSLTAANLAAALAQSGLSVTLVEADLRRPAIGGYFGIKTRSAGLSDALAQGQLNGQLRSTSIDGLSILDSGDLPTNPTRLLHSANLRSVLDDLGRRSDVVVIDSPPVLPVADTMILARHVDGVLLVLRAGQTRWQTARQALERLHQVKAHVAGAVLNGVPTRSSAYSGYYYSGYHADRSKRHARTRPSLAARWRALSAGLLHRTKRPLVDDLAPVAAPQSHESLDETAVPVHPINPGQSRE